ncbi:hypothetical protein CONLIGDRAFT_648219 [Coniochaeta ligniaria NRRL 30616]|uniref:Uncharacterized protein n=1 Tax=Coniochaeta ligniaria NRRL 30616 TaxID=1408157 RepID=A0A1J7IVN6_9PEZI|nr:hypothetical protein CONLIGDRAFT_648219 [Coniochaeta ligniaria NRRL 30616]
MELAKNTQDATDSIIKWLGSVNDELRFSQFQILDTLAWHYVRFGNIPAIGEFRLPQDDVEFATFVSTHFQSLNLEGVGAQLRIFERFRPAGKPLPLLYPQPEDMIPQSYADDVQQPASKKRRVGQQGQMDMDDPQQQDPQQQPARQTLDQVKDIKDHTWRGLVEDRDHAQQIIFEYTALEHADAQRMIENYQIKNNLADIVNDQELQDILSNPIKGKAYVFELFQAMVDFTDVVDKQLKVRTRKPRGNQAAQQVDANAPAEPEYKDSLAVERVKNTPDAILEALCWILLESTVEAQRGNIYTSPWQNMKNHRLYEPYKDFRTRLDTVLEALRKSKALIDNIMGTSMVRRLAAVPHDMLHRKYANNALNAKRDVQNKAGILMLNRLRAESDASAARQPPEHQGEASAAGQPLENQGEASAAGQPLENQGEEVNDENMDAVDDEEEEWARQLSAATYGP